MYRKEFMNTHIQLASQALILLLFLCLTACTSAAMQKEKTALYLEHSPDGRYLQWQDGTPFFVHADTAWALPYDYTE